MTEHGGVALRSLLPGPFELMGSEVQRELCKDKGIRGASLAWDFIGAQSAEAINGVLDCDVFELVARGWCVAKELKKYAAGQQPQGQRSVIHLGKHSFEKNVHPLLIVTIDGFKAATLRFTLTLAANFRAAALTIFNGYITEVAAGDGSVSAELKYGDVTLHTKESRPVALPLSRKFNAPGLEISSQ